MEPQAQQDAGTSPASSKNRAITLTKAILIAGICWGVYFATPLSAPSSITVEGISQVTVEEVQQEAGIKKGISIWGILAQSQRIKTRLTTQNEKIVDAGITLTGWNALTLTLRENPAVGYFTQDGQTYELLADKRTLAVDVPSYPDAYPKLVNFSEETLQQLAVQFDKVNASVIAQIKEVDYPNASENPQKIYLKMKDGLRVIGSLTDIGDKLNNYPGIVSQLPQKTGTIDMEVGIFYTPDVNAQ